MQQNVELMNVQQKLKSYFKMVSVKTALIIKEEEVVLTGNVDLTNVILIKN